MRLSRKLPRDIMDTLTPSPASSRTSMSYKTPGKDFKDRWNFDKVSYVGS